MKKRQNKTLLVIVLILLISNMIFLAFIHFNTLNNTEEIQNEDKKRPRFEQMLFEELNLEQKQIDIIKEERREYRKDKLDLKKQMREIRIQINNEITSCNTNMATIDSLTNQFAQVHITFDKLNIESLLAIKKHLNEEQISKFDSIIGNFAMHRKHMHPKRTNKIKN